MSRCDAPYQNLYRESRYEGNPARDVYLTDIERLLEREQKNSVHARDVFFAGYPASRETLRSRFLHMLGWPLVDYDAKGFVPHADMTPIGSDAQADIFRTTVEVMPGLRFGGIFFRAVDGQTHPLVICQHGGLGTPELISGFYDGDSSNYSALTRRVLSRNVHVFAPQLLLWDETAYRIRHDRNSIDQALKQLGGSISALEIYAIMRSLDALSVLPYVDETKLGMVGLSYGGFYTLFTAAADPRLKSCVASGFFNDRIKYNWTDWIWQNAAHTFLDAEVGALVAPRGLRMQLGTRDQLFAEQPSRQELERLKVYFDRAGCSEKLTMEYFDGDHMFSESDETLDLFMNDLLGGETR